MPPFSTLSVEEEVGGAGSEALRRELGLGREVIGFAGAFHPWHGAPDLVEAFAKLDRPGTRLLLIGGGGDDLDKCRVLARRAGMEQRVIFTGKVPVERYREEFPLEYARITKSLGLPAEPASLGTPGVAGRRVEVEETALEEE